MNSTYSDKLKASGTLTGSAFTDNSLVPRSWKAIYAHEDSVVNITSTTMTVGNGTTLLSAEATSIPAGSTFFCFASVIVCVSGEVTCYRTESA